MLLKKALINFAMIQTFVFASSVSLGVQFTATNGVLVTVAFVYLVAFLLSFLPALLVSFAFAALAR